MVVDEVDEAVNEAGWAVQSCCEECCASFGGEVGKSEVQGLKAAACLLT